jgi:hypothetical protein
MYGEPVIGNIIIMMVTYGFREPGEEEAKIWEIFKNVVQNIYPVLQKQNQPATKAGFLVRSNLANTCTVGIQLLSDTLSTSWDF